MATEKKSEMPDTNSEPKNEVKGIRKVNLADLVGSLSKRGRNPFTDDILKAALMELLNGKGNENAFEWIDGYVDPTLEENEQTKLKAKFRQRANSVADQIAAVKGIEFPLTIQYTSAGEMVITKRNA